MSRTTFARNMAPSFWMEQDALADDGIDTLFNDWENYHSRSARAKRFRLDGEEDF